MAKYSLGIDPSALNEGVTYIKVPNTSISSFLQGVTWSRPGGMKLKKYSHPFVVDQYQFNTDKGFPPKPCQICKEKKKGGGGEIK